MMSPWSRSITMAKRTRSRRDPAKERLWRRAIKRWEKSGQTMVAFCRETDLSSASLQWWRRELAKCDREAAGNSIRRSGRRPSRQGRQQRANASHAANPRSRSSSAVTFAPVRVTADPGGLGQHQTIEIVLPSRSVVRVGPDVDREALSMVIAVLEHPSC